MREEVASLGEPEEPDDPWGENSGYRSVFGLLLSAALIVGGLGYIHAAHRAHSLLPAIDRAVDSAIANSSQAAGAGVTTGGGGGGVTPTGVGVTPTTTLPLEPIPRDEPRRVEIPVWVAALLAFLCTAILFFGLLIAYLLYEAGKWLSGQEKKCKANKRKRWWQKLLCFLTTILKWLAWIVAVIVLIAAIILTIICIAYALSD